MAPIDVAQAAKDYVEGAKAKVEKLIRKYTARTDILDRAVSPDAEKAFKERVVSDLAIAKRRAHLKDLTIADLHEAMKKKAPVTYPAGVEAAQARYQKRVEPFLKELDLIVPKLPAKTADARTNVLNRVVPIAVGLQNKAKSVYGVK
jgi:hypothetical protein